MVTIYVDGEEVNIRKYEDEEDDEAIERWIRAQPLGTVLNWYDGIITWWQGDIEVAVTFRMSITYNDKER